MSEYFDVFAECATDSALENEGVWRNISKNTRIKVARANNRAYSKLLNKLIEENKQVLDERNPDGSTTDAADAKSDEILVECYARTILRGFDKISYQGKVLEYSLENARMLLRHTDFLNLVGRKSGEFDAYKVKQEADQGNG